MEVEEERMGDEGGHCPLCSPLNPPLIIEDIVGNLNLISVYL